MVWGVGGSCSSGHPVPGGFDLIRRPCLECGKYFSPEETKHQNERACSIACSLANLTKKKKPIPLRKEKKPKPPIPKKLTKRERRRLKRDRRAPKPQPAKPAPVKVGPSKVFQVYGSSFYLTEAWRTLRYRVIKIYGRRCMACGSTSGAMHVDHIKPRSRHPALELDFNNLQILCEACNLGKGAWDETDWRQK